MARIEDRLAPDGPAVPDGSSRGSIMDQRKLVVAGGAGLVAFAGARLGVLKSIPGVGPVPAAAVTILLGLFLASGTIGRAGMAGGVIEGAGIGLVAIGALELAGA